ncbi:hypothetical protein IOC44_08870 [Vibrio vulnificus]|uniref:hypothetical protein n=1 Tax=Vibrio vulnificus TaxID=672 RepID=UPI001E4EF874|nr:hypothetical protein [Vibrio vulnificus]MCD1409666.1 hypothetical protein [Vibrio vulnificus]MCD1422732.1 hypothetical protein [Vibrio vulnificus]
MKDIKLSTLILSVLTLAIVISDPDLTTVEIIQFIMLIVEGILNPSLTINININSN